MSLATHSVRLSLRVVRVTLRATRDVAEAGLEVVDLLSRALGATPPQPAPERGFSSAPVARPVVVPEAPEPVPEDLVSVDEPLTEEVELVEEVAEPGAEEGAGAQIRIAPPWAGYDALRAADVIARLRDSDAAQLAAIELYEASHKRRRTVLQAVGREARRRH